MTLGSALYLHLEGTTPLRASTADSMTRTDVIEITLGTWPNEATIYLPQDDEDALIVLDRLEAVLDNLASVVRLRQDRREAADLGIRGAGASVEAYRG